MVRQPGGTALTGRRTHCRSNRLAAQRDRPRWAEIAQPGAHTLEALERVDLETEARVDEPSAGQVIREVRLVESDRLDDAGPGCEHDPDVLLLGSKRGCAEDSCPADREQRRGVALTTRLEQFERLAELGRDIDTSDLAVDCEVTGTLQTHVLFGDCSGDPLAELVEACGVEAEARGSSVAAVAQERRGRAVQGFDDVDTTGGPRRALGFDQVEAGDERRTRVALGDAAGNEADD